MAPIVGESLPEKKKTSIRRLLTPAIFVNESSKRRDTPPSITVKRKTINGCSKDGYGGRTTVETAFVGNDTNAISGTSVNRYRSSDVKLSRKKRSKSLSPVRPKGASNSVKTRVKDGNSSGIVNNDRRREEVKSKKSTVSSKDVCKIPKAVNSPTSINGKDDLQKKSTWSPYSYRTEAVARQCREKINKTQNTSTVAAIVDDQHVIIPNNADDGSSSVSSSPTLTPDDNRHIRSSETDDRSYETVSSSCESMPFYSPSKLPSGRTSAPPVVPYSQYYNKPSSRHQRTYIVRTDNDNNNNSNHHHRHNHNNYNNESGSIAVLNGVKDGRTIPLTNGAIPILTKVQHEGLRLVRPQPIYNGDISSCSSIEEYIHSQQRPRSISPTTALKRDDSYFVRGSGVRTTIGAYKLDRSTIYEMIPPSSRQAVRNLPSVRRKLLDENRTSIITSPSSIPKPLNATAVPAPIFKRGALLPSTISATGEISPISSGSSSTPTKKVSFSPNQEHSTDSNQIYWPTRKGMAPEPPTRQSSKLTTANNTIHNRFLSSSVSNDEKTTPISVSNSLYVNLASTQPSSPSVDDANVKMSKSQPSESESGSEAGEVRRIFQNGVITNYVRRSNNLSEEDWNASDGGKNRIGSEQSSANRQDDEHKKGGRSNRRDDPRRHTLSGDHSMVNSGQYRPANSVNRSVDLEMPSARGYPIPSNSLFDDDPGIMSEAETSSTGFRRGNKQRSSLPVVRTPSKTLERPLGLVFLQYRNETKKSLLPNEITSLDTVKALFVRSFPKQLTMDYLDTPGIKIYIHDAQKNMFYELEDSRLHLNEIRGGSILRLYDYAHGPLPPNFTSHPGIWDQDQSYFSEPEFDSEFEHQHIHKSKINKSGAAHQQSYYMTHSFPPGSSSAVPRAGPLLRPYSPGISHGTASKQHPGFMSSPERAAAPSPRGYNPYRLYEDPYYAQFAAARSNSITPIIDEETGEAELLDESFNLYGGNVKIPVASSRANPYNMAAPPAAVAQPTFDNTRLRVEHMERQLANLTGLVQKALTHTPTSSPREREFSVSSDKSVSFEKSVSFSDDPPDLNSPKQHSPQHTADSKPTKPAIKSSTLPRTSSQERERLKPAPPPKPLNLSTVPYDGRNMYRDMQLTPEMYNQLRGLQKRAKDLRQDLRNLRRISQAQTHAIKETIKDTFIKIRSVILSGGENLWCGNANSEKIKVQREEDLYKQEMIRLEHDLTELESTVEELRGNVINRKTRVNMSDVENMALILSKSSKTVADLKLRFPILQNDLKSVVALELDRVVIVESFLKEEPDRLESALKRCKKLTGTLVTLKRLASVQEQRLPDIRLSPTADETPPITPTSGKIDGSRSIVGQPIVSGHDTVISRIGGGIESSVSAENTLDSLLEELKTFSKLPVQNIPNNNNNNNNNSGIAVINAASGGGVSTLRRLNSFPSASNSSSIDKPPVPERHSELLNKRVPPPPPPRTSSKSPLASPTNVNAPVRSLSLSSPTRKNSLSAIPKLLKDKIDSSTASSSSCESINSQEGIQSTPAQSRQEQLEIRHQELLKKQKALQEQYTRLQQLQRGVSPISSGDPTQLKKTGSESNLLGKLGLGFSATTVPNAVDITSGNISQLNLNTNPQSTISSSSVLVTDSLINTANVTVVTTLSSVAISNSNQSNNKVYETDIL